MGKTIVRVTSKRKEALAYARAINRSMLKRKIKRKAYVTPVSQSYVRSLTRKGYPIKKKNYGVAMKNIK